MKRLKRCLHYEPAQLAQFSFIGLARAGTRPAGTHSPLGPAIRKTTNLPVRFSRNLVGLRLFQ